MFLKKRIVNNKLYWSIAENFRVDSKVKQKVIKSLGPTEKAIKILEEKADYHRFLPKIYEVINKKLAINTIHHMDCRYGLKLIDDDSIDCCITSPPYWGLRDYGVNGQIGLEESLEEYISTLENVFDEVMRVLKPDGTLWLNLGDGYVGTGGDRKNPVSNELFQTQQKSNPGDGRYNRIKKMKQSGLKPKDLMGVPWRIALALQQRGWYLRSDIIWHKSNCMPEAVTDRPTKSHEYMFLLSKSRKYYYDHESIKEVCVNGDPNPPRGSKGVNHLNSGRRSEPKEELAPRFMKNKRDVWTVATSRFRGAHYATFPPELIEPCVKAGCREGGIVLDPFMGSGTTASTSIELRRNFIGFELNKESIELAEKERLNNLQLKIV